MTGTAGMTGTTDVTGSATRCHGQVPAGKFHADAGGLMRRPHGGPWQARRP
jgi:hypothetical protein